MKQFILLCSGTGRKLLAYKEPCYLFFCHFVNMACCFSERFSGECSLMQFKAMSVRFSVQADVC